MIKSNKKYAISISESTYKIIAKIAKDNSWSIKFTINKLLADHLVVNNKIDIKS
jgi:hypothetical protein